MASGIPEVAHGSLNQNWYNFFRIQTFRLIPSGVLGLFRTGSNWGDHLFSDPRFDVDKSHRVLSVRWGLALSVMDCDKVFGLPCAPVRCDCSLALACGYALEW